MKSLFTPSQRAAIDSVAKKSQEELVPHKGSSKSARSVNSELTKISKEVEDYFYDSNAILITDAYQLHEYVDDLIEAKYAGIDTETTGLDRIHDHIVGVSLYYPGGVECYIPSKHLVPIFDEPYKGQLSYEEIQKELQRISDAGVRLIFANADFDLAMIYKDIKVDLCDNVYYDVLLAWRCMKEDERDNTLKGLYNKYVLKGKGDPKKFTDFFSPSLFPYCKPQIARLYAANDARITYDLFVFQLQYITKTSERCIRANLQQISDLFWDVEMPLVKVCQNMHRTGIYLDTHSSQRLKAKYNSIMEEERAKLQKMVQDAIDASSYVPTFGSKRPFTSGSDFNPTSPPHVTHLLKDILKLPQFNTDKKTGTGKDVLADINLPITKQILLVRSYGVLINTFVEKMPNATAADGRIHAQFKQIGADTGRMSSASPNLQNIPSHATDIRHMFRATPAKELSIDCEEKGGLVTVSLPRYYSVKVDGSYKQVTDLCEGDQVELLYVEDPVIMSFRGMSDNKSDISKVDLMFE